MRWENWRLQTGRRTFTTAWFYILPRPPPPTHTRHVNILSSFVNHAWKPPSPVQEALEAAARAERSMSDRAGGGGGGGGTALVPSGGFSVGAWLDSIQLTNEQQAMVLKYVPILGPILGSGFIIGLYLLARLVKVGFEGGIGRVA